MPINIYIENGKTLDWLCGEDWDLPSQIYALENWLKERGADLQRNNYVADIGFDIRSDASGGGGVLSSEAMRIMGEIGMDIYFSEYPNSINK